MSADDRRPFDEEVASVWAARLDGGGVGPGERAELEEWLAGAPGRRALLASYCQISVDLDSALPELVAEGRIPVPGSAGAGRRRRAWALAGALAAAAAALALWLGTGGTAGERMSAEAGRSRSFTLADGSRVQLNANTTITVASSRSERRVRLADGEAFFEVSKDRERPFIVDTPAGLVRVTGTKFDVRTASASELEVVVVEGSVQVRPAQGDPVAIGPGDRLLFSQGSVSLNGLSGEALSDALAWRHGGIVCTGMPLSELIEKVSRYHGRPISVSRGAALIRIGGRFTLADLDQFFRDLGQTEPQLQVAQDAAGGLRVALKGEN